MIIDDLDLRLLEILKHQGRLSATAIAQKLNISNHKVQYRMHRLEKQGIIYSYTYLVNLEAATHGFYAVFRMSADPKQVDAIISKIMSLGLFEVVSCLLNNFAFTRSFSSSSNSSNPIKVLSSSKLFIQDK